MLVKYVCEYCGKIRNTEKEALVCEEKALRKKPKFKIGEAVYDIYGYKYKILRIERWRIKWAKTYELMEESQVDNVATPLLFHTFLYVLEALDTEAKEIPVSESTVYKYAFLEKQIPPDTKGLALRDEEGIAKEAIML